MRSAGVLPVIQQEARVAHTSEARSVHHVLQVIKSLPVGHSAHNVIRVEMYAHSEWEKVQNQIFLKIKILPLKKYSTNQRLDCTKVTNKLYLLHSTSSTLLVFTISISLKRMYSKLTSFMPILFS